MQDHRGRLRKNRKGVIDLPIKLMVVMILLTISIPIISNALETNESNMITAEAEQESKRIMNGLSSAYYSGIGSSISVDVRLPAGAEISIGGEGSDAYSMRILQNGKVSSTTYFERPAIKITSEYLISGHCTLLLTSRYIGDTPSMDIVVL